MKKIRSRLLIISFFSITLMLIFTEIITLLFQEVGDIYSHIESFGGILLLCFFSYNLLQVGIDYEEDYLIRIYLFGKEKIPYNEIVKFSSSYSPGMYVIEGYDGRKYNIYLPMEHKKIKELFETIRRVNRSVVIDVSWYEKEQKNIFRDMLRFAIFVIFVLIIDFIRRHINFF